MTRFGGRERGLAQVCSGTSLRRVPLDDVLHRSGDAATNTGLSPYSKFRAQPKPRVGAWGEAINGERIERLLRDKIMRTCIESWPTAWPEDQRYNAHECQA